MARPFVRLLAASLLLASSARRGAEALSTPKGASAGADPKATAGGRRAFLSSAGAAAAAAAAAVSISALSPPEPASAAPPMAVIAEELGYFPVTDREGRTLYVPARARRRSTEQAVDLAEHLRTTGAKMYGGVLVPPLLQPEGDVREGGVGIGQLRRVQPEGVRQRGGDVRGEGGGRVSDLAVREREGGERGNDVGGHSEDERLQGEDRRVVGGASSVGVGVLQMREAGSKGLLMDCARLQWRMTNHMMRGGGNLLLSECIPFQPHTTINIT
eukprot:CAMPEP_0183305718 /NCGR_PEP_ID=MMETSP0160_2-20130417/10372_1 /TAXON_ID=2839 ORGANISM="Odontella Sinensis, Strain Grunow 1884" /NCGR_SAMPLE_ID=MMETSP0160_2 /ASSEMBLY_ACC=CAM_ASM_000250 /LENGTH=271 /DNA_ID=CAMNT_0025468965 /DNA_START=50 /DNA_END=864 /DNA_ORIENTATION=+